MIEMPSIPIVKSKILSCYREIKDIENGKIPVPRCVKIFVSEACNHRCKGCHSLVLFSRKHPYLDPNLYFRLIDEWLRLGVEGVNFTGGGEPLMHPQIEKMIQYAGRKKMGTGILTNGTLMNEKIMSTILDYCTYIRIGIDAATRAVYKAHTGADHFGLLVRNIKKIIKVRERMKSKTTIGLKFLITKNNLTDIEKACLLASELKVDYLHFKPSRNSRHEINSDLAGRVNRIIENQKMKFSRRNFHIFGNVDKTKTKTRCFLNMLSPVLDTDGSLYICHFFRHRRQSHGIGNLSKKNFSQLWFDKRHIEKVRMIKIKECQLYNCPMHEAHEIVKKDILENKLHLQFV